MTNVTVLVHNRPALTKQALDSMGEIDAKTLLLFDNAADRDTFRVVDEWSDSNHNPTKNCFHVETSHGTGWARNEVVRMSEKNYGRGEYLYLSDNDVFFHPNWLPTLIERYEQAWKYGFRVLGGVGHPYHQQADTPVVGVKEVLAQPLQSMILRWSVWDDFGPFDETEPGKVCQGEDTFFSHRIMAAGYKIGVVDPPLLVNTGITNSFGEKIPGWELVKAQCPEGVICE